jgi:hypothetical protein
MPYGTRQLAWLILLPFLLETTSGCSILGFAIGSAIPRQKTIISTSEPPVSEPMPVQQSCSVQTANESFDGVVNGVGDSQIHLAREPDNAFAVIPVRDVSISVQDVRSMSCREGTYALPGFAVGLVIDLVLVPFFVLE